MSATNSNASRRKREPLSPTTIRNRVNVAIIIVILLFTAFVLPWVAR